MLLAFFIDQIQQRCCKNFQLARQKAEKKLYLWNTLRSFALAFMVDSWDVVHGLIAKKITYKVVLDTC